jgi:hypothetical protein
LNNFAVFHTSRRNILIAFRPFPSPFRSQKDALFACAWIRFLSREVIDLRQRMEELSIKTPKARIISYILTVLEKVRLTRLELLDAKKDYLAYVMPGDYIMQGMIADTGGAFHLRHGHNTFALITDWVIHPFEHLRRSPAEQMARMHGVDPAIARKPHCPIAVAHNLNCENCPYRRNIFVEVDHAGKERLAGKNLFAFGTSRTPVGFIDVNTVSAQIASSQRVGKATAWMDVPTPSI